MLIDRRDGLGGVDGCEGGTGRDRTAARRRRMATEQSLALRCVALRCVALPCLALPGRCRASVAKALLACCSADVGRERAVGRSR